MPTTLTVAKGAKVNVAELSHGSYHFINVAATLSGGGSPLAGEPIRFTAGGVQICLASTGSDGSASCGGDVMKDASDFSGGTPGSVLAKFAGDGGLQSSTSDPGALAVVG